MIKLFKEYLNVLYYINEKISLKDRFFAKASSLALSIFFIIAPLLMCFNMLLMYQLQIIIAFIVVVIILVGTLLYTKFYIDVFKSKFALEIKSFKSFYIVNTIVMALLLSIVIINLLIQLR